LEKGRTSRRKVEGENEIGIRSKEERGCRKGNEKRKRRNSKVST
jgi:hypothetical protein